MSAMPAVPLCIRNTTARDVELRWVGVVNKTVTGTNCLEETGAIGTDVLYATLGPGDVHEQQTFAGHRWQLREQPTADTAGSRDVNGDTVAVTSAHPISGTLKTRAAETRLGSCADANLLADITVAEDCVHSLSLIESAHGQLSSTTSARVVSRGEPLVQLHVQNKTPVAIALLWVASDDREVEYARISANSSETQDTLQGHVWRLRTAGTATAPSDATSSALLAETRASADAQQRLVLTHSLEARMDDAEKRRHGHGSEEVERSEEDLRRQGIVKLKVANDTDDTVELLWLKAAGDRTESESELGEESEWYADILPGGQLCQLTTLGSNWVVRARPPLLAEGTSPGYEWRHTAACAPLARVSVAHAVQRVIVSSREGAARPLRMYAQRVPVGIGALQVCAGKAVDGAALDVAAQLLRCMLADCPVEVLSRLSAAHCRLAVIGRAESTSDVPEQGARPKSGKHSAASVDALTRGLGGTPSVPVTSCGEENLLRIAADPHYPLESILVHEFGHTVMNVGLSDEKRREVQIAFHEALRTNLYSRESYIGSCADEYWAEGVQAWFDASARADVNEVLNTRSSLRTHDQKLASLLGYAFGDGAWRFTQTLPPPTAQLWRRRQAASAIVCALRRRVPERAGAIVCAALDAATCARAAHV